MGKNSIPKKRTTSMLLLCVYLPYKCNDNYDEYLNCMNKIVQIVFEYPIKYKFLCHEGLQLRLHSRGSVW